MGGEGGYKNVIPRLKQWGFFGKRNSSCIIILSSNTAYTLMSIRGQKPVISNVDKVSCSILNPLTLELECDALPLHYSSPENKTSPLSRKI